MNSKTKTQQILRPPTVDPVAIKPSAAEHDAIRQRFISQDISLESIAEAERSLHELDQRYERLTKIKKRIMWITAIISGAVIDRVALAMGWIRPEWNLSYHLKQLWNQIF